MYSSIPTSFVSDPAAAGNGASAGGGYGLSDPTLAPNQGSVNGAQGNDRFTTSQAGFALAKCIVGAGCFVLPGAVKNAGLWLGTISLLVLGAFTLYTINLVAWCANEYGVRKRHAASAAEWQLQQQQFYRYHGAQLQLRPEDAAAATETLQRLADEAANEPISLVSMGRDLIHPFARHIIRLGILLTILGVLAVYLDLIGHLLEQVLKGVSVPGFAQASWTQVNVQWALALPLLLLANLRQLKYLAFTSILGDIAVTACAIFVIVYGAQHSSGGLQLDLPAANFSRFPLFFASTVFLFAVHVVALPIAIKTQRPKDFSKAATISFAILSLGNAAFAAFGYMLYGAQTQGLILDNIADSGAGNAVKVLLCVDLLFTMPIIMTAPRELLEDLLLPRRSSISTERSLLADSNPASYSALGGAPATLSSSPSSSPSSPSNGDDVSPSSALFWKQTGIRLLIVMLMYALALLLPDLGDLVNLVGGLVSPLMGFILPPLFYISLQRGVISFSSIGAHVLIALFGLLAMGVSTYYTIQDILGNSK